MTTQNDTPNPGSQAIDTISQWFDKMDMRDMCWAHLMSVPYESPEKAAVREMFVYHDAEAHRMNATSVQTAIDLLRKAGTNECCAIGNSRI